MKLRRLPLAELTIEDDDVLEAVGVYRELKAALVAGGYRFAVPAAGDKDATWARVLFLNLTCWGGDGSDVLVDKRVPADVVAHAGWHFVARRALAAAGAREAGADALFLGEAVASAFDLYLVGRLLPIAPDCDFLATQVPAMADVAEEAGLTQARFEKLLAEIAAAPEQAFEDLRALLFDVLTALVAVDSVDAAAGALAGFRAHRFHALLHHYELSNWILSARAAAAGRPAWLAPDPAVRAVDAALRAATDALAELERRWLVAPAG